MGQWWRGEAVVLWTDALVFVLLMALLVFVVSVWRDDSQRERWSSVFRRPAAACAALLLLVYGAVGVQDSLHFRNASGQTLSALDAMLSGLREGDEKTYSAPLAAFSFSKVNVQSGDGGTQRVFPRLVFGGAHLGQPELQHGADLRSRVASGLVWGLVGSALLWGLLVLGLALSRRSLWLAWSDAWYGRCVFPWRSLWVTASLLLLLVSVAVALADGYHVLGTDKVGQDILLIALKSIRTGLIIGTLTTLIMLPFAIGLGTMAGYFRGWVDDLIQYVYTVLNSIPGVLLIAASILMLQVYMANNPQLFDSVEARLDARLLALCAILGVMNWTGLARLLRAETLKLRELDYVQAAQAFGAGHGRILWRHIVPNVMHLVLISVVLGFSELVLAEAVLSYIGIGVDPLMNSWGNMINAARLEMARDPMVWWPLVSAFGFMFVLVLAANVFSDAVRDAFDPRV